MSMPSGESEQGLRKILDMTRMFSIIVLPLHFYYYCYKASEEWQLTTVTTSRILANIFATGLFSNFNKPKLISLGLLMISRLSARGRKDEKLNYKIAFAYITAVC